MYLKLYPSLDWRSKGITENEILKLLKEMTIIVDTREQVGKNDHILNYFEKNKIDYVREKLDVGDYSYKFPNKPELSKMFSIERKKSLDEICNNFSKERDRFDKEFERAKNSNIKMNLVLENTSWTKIFNGSYRSQLHPNCILANIVRLEMLHDCPVYFCKPSECGELLYNLIIWNVKRILKEKY